MQNRINRREIIKFFFALGLPIISFLFGNKKRLNEERRNMYMNAIKKITQLPDSGPWPTVDPFLFCVHHNDHYPSATKNFVPDASFDNRNIGNDFSNKDGWSMYHGESIPGFPKHPHRGFETLTVVDKGFIDHSDSLGATARYGDGDAQWLTAGDGINHSEMFPLFDRKNQNVIDFFQIWINLPSYNKRVKPNFEMFWEKQIPKSIVKDQKGIEATVELICGGLNGVNPPDPPPDSWANDKNNEVGVWIIRLKKNGEFSIPKTDHSVSRSIYILKEGKVSLNGGVSYSNSMLELSTDMDVTLRNEGKSTKILMLQGKPINEPVYQYGPFVMNSRSEINEAFQDYHKTGFGGWKWEDVGPIHGKFEGKFAKLINGNIEKPS